jgi:hypothetical protein
MDPGVHHARGDVGPGEREDDWSGRLRHDGREAGRIEQGRRLEEIGEVPRGLGAVLGLGRPLIDAEYALVIFCSRTARMRLRNMMTRTVAERSRPRVGREA